MGVLDGVGFGGALDGCGGTCASCCDFVCAYCCDVVCAFGCGFVCAVCCPPNAAGWRCASTSAGCADFSVGDCLLGVPGSPSSCTSTKVRVLSCAHTTFLDSRIVRFL